MNLACVANPEPFFNTLNCFNSFAFSSFRYDYRINGRRETLTIGRYDESLSSKATRELDELEYGISLTLAEAILLLADARRSVEKGESPSRAKAEKRTQIAESLTFGSWAERYFADKSDPNNGARLADSTLAMRRSIYNRDLAGPFGKLKLEEITPAALMALCEKVKAFERQLARLAAPWWPPQDFNASALDLLKSLPIWKFLRPRNGRKK